MNEHLEALVAEAEHSLGRPPSTRELLELLAWAIRGLRPSLGLAFEPAGVTGLRAGFRRGAKPREPELDATRDFNDATWTAASDLVADLVRAHDGEPDLNELLSALAEAIGGSEVLKLADLDPADVVELKAQTRKTKPRPKAGDLVAIPGTSDDSWHLAVVITKNHFGTAFGVFAGERPPRPFPRDGVPEPLRYPFYSDDQQVLAGRWRIVAHDEDLLSHFPEDPELLHRPWSSGPVDRGPHGSAEKADGSLRLLSTKEADELGVERPDFVQWFLSPDLEQWLNGVRPEREPIKG